MTPPSETPSPPRFYQHATMLSSPTPVRVQVRGNNHPNVLGRNNNQQALNKRIAVGTLVLPASRDCVARPQSCSLSFNNSASSRVCVRQQTTFKYKTSHPRPLSSTSCGTHRHSALLKYKVFHAQKAMEQWASPKQSKTCVRKKARKYNVHDDGCCRSGSIFSGPGRLNSLCRNFLVLCTCDEKKNEKKRSCFGRGNVTRRYRSPVPRLGPVSSNRPDAEQRSLQKEGHKKTKKYTKNSIQLRTTPTTVHPAPSFLS